MAGIRFWLTCAVLFFLAAPLSLAQTVPFSVAANQTTAEASIAQAMQDLARRVLPLHKDEDRDRYLNTRLRLQSAAGQYADAQLTITSLRTLRGGQPGRLAPFEIFMATKLAESGSRSFDEAYRATFREYFRRFNDLTSIEHQYWFGTSLPRVRNDFQTALKVQVGKPEIALADAIELLRKFSLLQVLESTQPLAEALIAEDNDRRFETNTDLLIPAGEGVSISAVTVR